MGFFIQTDLKVIAILLGSILTRKIEPLFIRVGVILHIALNATFLKNSCYYSIINTERYNQENNYHEPTFDY